MSLSPYTLYGVSEQTASLAKTADEAVSSVYDRIDEVKTYNQLRILEVFSKHKFSEVHFGSTTGYGYDDIGRDSLKKVYADVFHAEAATVTPNT